MLNNSPYHVVANAAEQLEKRMATAVDPAVKKPRLFSPMLEAERALTASRARAVPGTVSFGPDARVDCDLVEYEDDRLPIAVLGHVWQEHHLDAHDAV